MKDNNQSMFGSPIGNNPPMPDGRGFVNESNYWRFNQVTEMEDEEIERTRNNHGDRYSGTIDLFDHNPLP